LSGTAELDVVGIGSMVVDRLRRVARIPGADAKALVLPDAAGAPVREFVGGVLLNQLGWAAALGLRTGLFGRQADDADGRFLRAAMDRLGVARHLVLDGSASSHAELFVDDEGGRAIYMAPGATAETSPEHVRDHHADFIRSAARVSTEVSQLPLPAVLEVLAIAREAGIPTVVDLDVPPADAVPALGDAASLEAVLRGADLLKPAKVAARALLGASEKQDALALAVRLRERFGNQAVVVTDGPAGCAIATEGVEIRVPAPPAKQVVDTTGAGDAFLGGLLVGLHQGLDWPDSARLANAAGAACVEKLGAFPDDPAAARARVRELYDGPELVWSEGAARHDPGASAIEAFQVMVQELERLRARSDPKAYTRAIALLREVRVHGGRIHVTGIGKPEHVARYAASILASTGTPAAFLHGTETVHGSAGQVVSGDAVIAISNSGETAELRAAVETVRALGARIVAVTGDADSWLARNAEVVLDAGVAREGGPLGFAPRASVAAEIVALAALSAALEESHGLTRADYHARHPGGALGKKSGS
jgi:arabinose-5-phosphate isomerase